EAGDEVETADAEQGRAHAHQDLAPAVLQDAADGSMFRFAGLHECFKFRGFTEAAADPQRDSQQRDGGNERDAPTPGVKVGLTYQEQHAKEATGGQDGTDRGTDLWKRGVACTLFHRRIFDGDNHRAAPLATDGEALDDAQGNQQDGGGQADGHVVRQQADEPGDNANANDRDHEDLLAAHLVTEGAEDEAADRAGHEANGECGEGAHGSDEGILGYEEMCCEQQSSSFWEKEEVVPFQRSAHEGSQGHLLGDAFIDDAYCRGTGVRGSADGACHCCSMSANGTGRWGCPGDFCVTRSRVPVVFPKKTSNPPRNHAVRMCECTILKPRGMPFVGLSWWTSLKAGWA